MPPKRHTPYSSQCPEQRVAASPDLLQRNEIKQLKRQLQETQDEMQRLNDAFTLGSGHASNSVNRNNAAGMDNEDLELFAPDRVEGFYSSKDTIHIPPIFLRLYYNTHADQYFVYWMKPPLRRNQDLTNTYMRISGFEFPSMIEWIDEIIKQIDAKKFHDNIECLKHPYAKNHNKLDDDSWDKAFTFTTQSGFLAVRVMRNLIGSYQFRFWVKKEDTNYLNWRGPTLTVALSVMRQMMDHFHRFADIIKQTEEGTMSKPSNESNGTASLDNTTDECASQTTANNNAE